MSNATAAPTSGTGGKTFVVISKQLQNPFFDFARDGCLAEAELLTQQLGENITCEYRGPDDADPAAQAAIVREVIERRPRVDGIAISVINAAEVTPVLIEAREAGFPVVTFDSDSLEEGRETYIGTDNWAMGQTLAKILQQLAPEGGLYGLVSDTAPNLAERERGFRDYMIEYDWIETDISPLYTADSISISLDRMEQFAALQPKLQAIVPVGGWPMFDSNETRYRNFVDANRNLTLVVADTLGVQVNLLMSGYADGLVGQVPYQMGVESIDALYGLSTGQPVKDTITLTFLMEMVRIPLVLPPLEVDENHVSSLRFIGYALFAIVAITAIYCIGWTWYKRKIRVVRASQPIFLIMIAAGALVLGSALIPMSFDDTDPSFVEDDRSDRACMAVPWLGCLGFAIAFSALFSKTWRINRIFHSRRAAHSRITVKERDVMIPLIAIVGANVIILLCWTLISPLKYVREADEGTDVWNRRISFYGACRSEDPSTPYVVALAVVDIGLLIISNWQAYEARSIQSEFAESRYIATIMVVLLQAGLTGLPILFVVRDIPRAFYLILVFVIFIVSMATLLLIFVPKIIYERTYQKQTSAERNAAFQQAVQRSRPAGQQTPSSTGFTYWSSRLKASTAKSTRTSGQQSGEQAEATARASVTVSDRQEIAEAIQEEVEQDESTSDTGTGMRIAIIDKEPIVIPMGRRESLQQIEESDSQKDVSVQQQQDGGSSGDMNDNNL
jgi:ABC-type sugar transport system substrate-binding protein